MNLMIDKNVSCVMLHDNHLENSEWAWLMLYIWFEMHCFLFYPTVNILLIEVRFIKLSLSTVKLISQLVPAQIT